MLGIQINNLSIGYGSRLILKNISAHIPANKLIGVVGPNGCGKSTLMKTLSGQLGKQKNTIHIDNQDLQLLPIKDRAKRIAYLPQSPQAPEGLTVSELLEYGRHPHQTWFQQWSKKDTAFIEELIQELALTDIVDTPLNSLSGGQRQRAWLGMVLAQDTPYILLDEPTSALDIGHQMEVMECIKKIVAKGKTVIIVIHDLISAARYCDELIAMKQGKLIIQGDTNEIINPQLIQELYGAEVDIIYSPQDNSPVIVPRRRQA